MAAVRQPWAPRLFYTGRLATPRTPHTGTTRKETGIHPTGRRHKLRGVGTVGNQYVDDTCEGERHEGFPIVLDSEG